MSKHPKFTFALIKPEAAGTTTEDEILKMIQSHGFQILQKKWISKPTPTQVASHFEELRHKNAEAFNRNFSHLLAGPVTVLTLTHSNPQINPVEALRALAGPTNPKAASKKTIRGRFGKDSILKATREKRALRNIIHCSETAEAAHQESNLWFHSHVSSLPKTPFTLQDNNDGDEITLEIRPNNQIHIKVAQCCVHRWEGEIPISILIDTLVKWEENYDPKNPQGVEQWPNIPTRIKIQHPSQPNK